MSKRINQCDGCQRGLPLVDSKFGGKIHKGKGYDMIVCTADRYKEKKDEQH